MVADPVSDLVVRIKNGYMSKAETVELPTSRMKTAVAKVLQETGYVEEVESKEGVLIIKLKYEKKNQPVLTDIRRVSKPGLRVYTGVSRIPRVLGGKGVSVLSTPKGIVSDAAARKLRVGGEIICKVW